MGEYRAEPPTSTKPWEDLWESGAAREDLIEGPDGLLDQGIDRGSTDWRGLGVSPRGAEVAGKITWLDREGMRNLIQLVTDLAAEARRDDWTAERFTVELVALLIHDHPLLPRLLGLLILDDLASDTCGAETPRGVWEDHRGAIRAGLDRVADQLRNVVRSHPETIDGHTLEYLERVGVY